MTSIPDPNSLPRDLQVTPVEASSPKKATPDASKLDLVFTYAPSPDGIDENLLIFFHGFGQLFSRDCVAVSYGERIPVGDTNVPFANLAKTLKLPQTATLSVRGSEPIPYLLPDDPPAFQYYPIYTLLGEPISSPNPSPILSSLVRMLRHLLQDCGWPEESIHLFGFGMGGTVAVELARTWTRERVSPDPSSTSSSSSTSTESGALGSVVTISGPLLSHPTIGSTPTSTPLLIVHRPGSRESAIPAKDLRSLKKGFNGRVIVEELPSNREGMPSSREEWLGVMKFWADVLRRKAVGDGLFHVG